MAESPDLILGPLQKPLGFCTLDTRGNSLGSSVKSAGLPVELGANHGSKVQAGVLWSPSGGSSVPPQSLPCSSPVPGPALLDLLHQRPPSSPSPSVTHIPPMLLEPPRLPSRYSKESLKATGWSLPEPCTRRGPSPTHRHRSSNLEITGCNPFGLWCHKGWVQIPARGLTTLSGVHFLLSATSLLLFSPGVAAVSTTELACEKYLERQMGLN